MHSCFFLKINSKIIDIVNKIADNFKTKYMNDKNVH